MNLPAVALGGPPLDRGGRAGGSLAVKRLLLAARAAGWFFLVHRLRHRRRTALHRQRPHRQGPLGVTDADIEPVAWLHLARRLDAFAVQLHPALIDRLRGEA